MKNKFTDKEALAKQAIRTYLDENTIIDIDGTDVDPLLCRRAACFVTVYIKGDLRGCIGNIEPVGPLYGSIIHNAVAAVSEDFRFPAISKSEYRDLTVEVSVLSPMRPYLFINQEELLKYLSHEKPGLVLEKFGREALFLPQVWKEIPEPQDFLIHLSLKAGLNPDDWKENAKFNVFTVTT
jgi:AmmeMemoRadiSam system protein A